MSDSFFEKLKKGMEIKNTPPQKSEEIKIEEVPETKNPVASSQSRVGHLKDDRSPAGESSEMSHPKDEKTKKITEKRTKEEKK